MIDARIEELVNADVDGRLPDGSRAELSRHLMADPEVRALHRDLLSLRRALDTVRPEPVPADFAAGVMERIPAVPARRASRTWRYAFALAASVAVATVALRLGSLDEGIDSAALVGTMANGGSATSAATLDRPGLAGSVQLRRAGDRLHVEVDVAARSNVDVVVTHAGRAASLAIRPDTAGQPQTVELPAAGAGPVTVRFAAQDRVIEEISLQVPGGP